RVPGLRLRAGGQWGDVDLSATTIFSGFAGAVPVTLQTRTQSHIDSKLLLIASLEYQRGPLRVTGEYYRQDYDIHSVLAGLPQPRTVVSDEQARPAGYYGQIAYSVTPRLQLSGYYSELFADRNDRSGSKLVLQGLPPALGYQKNLSLTAKVDVLPHWLVKLEFHDMHGNEA